MSDTPLLIGAEPAVAKATLVFVHGRTQTPEDMAGILAPLDLSPVHVVLPRAEGRSWYDAKAVDPLSPATRAQLAAALAQLDRDVAGAGAPPGRLIVGGFSQGACLAAEWAMRGGHAAGLALLTGCRVGQAGDERPTSRLDGVNVYASDGDKDPWIPLPNFYEMAGELAASGARLRTDVFPGREHGVTGTETGVLAALIAGVMEERTPW